MFRGCHCQDDSMYCTIEEVVAVGFRLNLLETKLEHSVLDLIAEYGLAGKYS